jgi:hypothetical protein
VSCHPAYFSLNYDELLLGENVTDDEFWRRYGPKTVGGEDPFRTRSLKVGGYCETGTTGMAGHDSGLREKREG